ncbi:hypothetical protein AB5I41_14715 [Sphingomonas sp. MMS24-JH45]
MPVPAQERAIVRAADGDGTLLVQKSSHPFARRRIAIVAGHPRQFGADRTDRLNDVGERRVARLEVDRG